MGQICLRGGGCRPLRSRVVQYRAIASDLDGTLLRADQTVSARTRAAIDAAEDAGMVMVIATGRPPRWIPPVVEQIGERGLVVCANGASVYDPARHELVARRDLSVEVARSLIDDIQGAFPHALLGVEQGFEFGVDDSVDPEDLSFTQAFEGLRIAPVRSFLTEPVTKLIVRFAQADDEQGARVARVRALVGDRALVTHSTNESFLELSRPDVHKASTVEQLLADAGVAPGEVMAFGDMPNDIELLRWAGLGVAVANAHPDVVAAADEVTTSNEEDGVARIIERVLDGR